MVLMRYFKERALRKFLLGAGFSQVNTNGLEYFDAEFVRLLGRIITDLRRDRVIGKRFTSVDVDRILYRFSTHRLAPKPVEVADARDAFDEMFGGD